MKKKENLRRLKEWVKNVRTDKHMGVVERLDDTLYIIEELIDEIDG
jgi:hypothetical protein